MNLQAHDAIHHLRADRLEPLGEIDVDLFVEARLQLDDDRHFLAAPRRFFEDVDHYRADTGAVQRHADRDDLGVGGRLAQELDDRLEAFEGVMQQDVIAPDRLEEVGARRKLRLATPVETASNAAPARSGDPPAGSGAPG